MKTGKEQWSKLEKMQGKAWFLHFFRPTDKKTVCVLGDDRIKTAAKKKFIETWSEKKYRKFDPRERVLKKLVKDKEEISNLIFYGFSFGKSDKRIAEFVSSFLKEDESRKIYIYWKGSSKKGLNLSFVDEAQCKAIKSIRLG